MKLYLENGMVVEGKSFGADMPVAGEVVFNTGMMGYVETLSDPSYTGQIVVLTYPMVGNYGVPDKKRFESEKIHAAGLIVSEYCDEYSHYEAKESLAEWLKRSGVPAMTGVDTRAITKVLREKGVMLGQLTPGKKGKFVDPNKQNLVAKVSPTKKKEYGEGPLKIVLVDCGAKENIVRSIMTDDTTVIRVPWDYDFTNETYDGIVLSNGPGDPTAVKETVENVKKALKGNKPILGICLGTQVMALAAGAKTYKLKYGHRAQNQPCVIENRCYITSQNHGYSVDAKSLPKDWKVWFTNANDESVEGIMHAKKPFYSVQFHPEACPGPTDTHWIFEQFLTDVKKAKKKKV